MASMRARVELRSSLTHSGGGRAFKKGSPQIITNPAEIAYYQSQGGFAVTMLDAPKKKAPTEAPPSGGADDGDGDEGHTEGKLNAMNKAQLVEVAEEYELVLDDGLKKADMVAAILEAQEG